MGSRCSPSSGILPWLVLTTHCRIALLAPSARVIEYEAHQELSSANSNVCWSWEISLFLYSAVFYAFQLPTNVVSVGRQGFGNFRSPALYLYCGNTELYRMFLRLYKYLWSPHPIKHTVRSVPQSSLCNGEFFTQKGHLLPWARSNHFLGRWWINSQSQGIHCCVCVGCVMYVYYLLSAFLPETQGGFHSATHVQSAGWDIQ